ncbi:MAG: hypothetical protein IT569_08440 [Leptospiraceae bacterium]|nr:hypothetical protein [Leptospiraceae bacterium]
MNMQYSTALSDFVLAMTTGYAVYVSYQRKTTESFYASLGLLTFVLAAIFGIIRFGIQPSVLPAHQFLSNFAAYVGVPLIGASFISFGLYKISRNSFLYIVISLLLLFNLFTYVVKFPLYPIIVGGLANLGILIAGIREIQLQKDYALCAIGGSLLTILAGLLIGTEGSWFGILRVDWFHYSLSIANILLGQALKKHRNI